MAKIAVDAGHGLYTPGKRCLRTLDVNETREWVLNNIIATEVCRLLLLAGHEVLRVDDVSGKNDIELRDRVRKANAWGADFYISIHHNAGVKGGTGGGIEIFVSKGCSKTSVLAQNALYKHTVAQTNLKGNRSDGTKVANLYVVRYTNMPACLIECGFMDSATDIKYILNRDWAMKMALGIVEGICEVFGGTIKDTPQPSKPVVETKNKLKVDGYWGVDTTKLTQQAMGTKVDGKISRQPKSNKKYLPNCETTSWKFATIYKGGSQLIKAIQKLVGVKQDGYCGTGTVTAIQKFLKLKGYYHGVIDGIMGTLTVKAWQSYINSRI